MDFIDLIIERLDTLDSVQVQQMIDQFNKAVDPLARWAQEVQEKLAELGIGVEGEA